MYKRKYDLIDVAEDVSKGLCSFGTFIYRYFYQVSNLEALSKSYDSYSLSRFDKTIETFQYDYEKLSAKEKEDFFNDLKYNEQNLHYLYSLFDNARKSTYLIHMKILSLLSSKLVQNRNLEYWESNLLSNIYSLTESDFLIFHKIVSQKKTSKQACRWGTESEHTEDEVFVVSKFQNLGFFAKEGGTFAGGSGAIKAVVFYINDNTLFLYDILESIKDVKN